MDHRAPPREPQLPWAVAPPRRRRTPRGPRQPTIPAVHPPAAALHVPSAAPHQIPALRAVAGAAHADNLMLLAHTAVSQFDAEAQAAFPPAPAPAGEELPSSPPLPPAAAGEEEDEPDDAPPLSPMAVDHQDPSSMSTDHGHAATKASAEDSKTASCPQGTAVDVAGSSKGAQSGGAVASPADGASPMQLGDDGEELEPGEIPPEKPAAGWDADPGHGSLVLAKEEMVAAAEEAEMTIAGEPAATGNSARRAAAAVVAASKGKAAETVMSAAEQKRKREVFVGGLSRDAVEEDVRDALSAAGEITQVRMFMDRTTNKNKGYCFVAYRDASMATKAVAEFGNLKICGKSCRVAVPERNEKDKIAKRDPIIADYNRMYEQRQQLPPAVHSSHVTSWDHHTRHENNTYALPAASYVVPPVVATPAGYYIRIPMYHNGNGVYLPAPDLNRGGLAGPSGRSQMGQSGSGRPAGQPHRSRK